MLSQGMPAQEVFKVIGEPKGVVPGVQQQ
jgi:hypothetical protein